MLSRFTEMIAHYENELKNATPKEREFMEEQIQWLQYSLKECTKNSKLHNEKAYEQLLAKIMLEGEPRNDRTGVGTHSIFGAHIELDLEKSFPILTKKRMFIKTMLAEVLWMLRGDDNIDFLRRHNVKIWDEWADPDGFVGPMYGYQWRKWTDRSGLSVDQVKRVVYDIQKNPAGRRHIVSAWNVGDIPFMKLPPCHILWQLYVTNNNRLDLQMYQRSADMFLGVPYDICLYSILMHLICGVTGHIPGKLKITFGDTHIYNNHREQVSEYLNRKYDENNQSHKLIVSPRSNIDDYVMEDVELVDYKPQNAIKAEVAV